MFLGTKVSWQWAFFGLILVMPVKTGDYVNRGGGAKVVLSMGGRVGI